MKILVVCPCIRLTGGVAQFYSSLRKYWSERVVYQQVGTRDGRAGSGKIHLPLDVIAFILKLIFFRPDVVLLNPSFDLRAMRRDMFIQSIAKIFGFNTAVFIRGFDWDEAKMMPSKWVAKHLNKANVIFVLSKDIETELRCYGVIRPIVPSTTKVDDELLLNFDINNKNWAAKNLLFLTRIEQAKGIFITLDTYGMLKDRYPDISLRIVGDGSALSEAKKYVQSHKLKDVVFTGALKGKDLINEYASATYYILPSYAEGMPNSLLEAMAFGLVCMTRNVGGIPSFFENGRMGYSTDSFEPETFAAFLSEYLDDVNKTKSAGEYNCRYAKNKFLASEVARKLESELRRYTL